MEVYLIDGTYELFRHYYALPSARDADRREVGAVRGVLASVLGMIRGGATHVAVATDHVIESFRNDLWPGYKTGAGIEPDLLSQFQLLEDVLMAAGVVVWPMVEFEADDALAAGAALADGDPPSIAFSSARRTKISRNAFAERESCRWTGDLAPFETRMECGRSSVCLLLRYRITLRSSVTRPTAIPDFRVGARNRRLQYLRGMSISRTSPPTGERGESTQRARAR